MEILLLLLVAIIVISIDYFIAKEFQTIANEKGFCSTKYFWFTFLLGVIGIMMVIALPDRKSNDKENENLDDLPEI